jgi:hypothetical protein
MELRRRDACLAYFAVVPKLRWTNQETGLRK